jgi:hypothetical protein
LWIANNQQNIVGNFHQDFVAYMHSDFLQGQTDKAYSVGLAISGKISCANKKKKKNVMLPDAVFLVMCNPSMYKL